MIHFAYFGAFFVALALAGPAWPRPDVGLGAAPLLTALVSATDGSKVYRVETSAQPRQDQLRLAARITDGVSNSCHAFCVDAKKRHPPSRP
jgi:hypothetical protein